MTIVTALPRNQAIIDFYDLPAGNSYKKTGIKFGHGEHRIKAMIYKYARGIMRTRSQQMLLSASTNKTFCPEDLGLIHIKPCEKCGIPLVGPVENGTGAITCGLCVAWIARAA